MLSRPVRSIYFDGKKVATLVNVVGKNGKPYQRTEIQDHYVIIEEPNDVFLGHVVPPSGHGISIAVAIYRYLKERGWHKDLIGIGSDGTNVNVGLLKGAFPYLEKLIGHEVHWWICELHGIELPWRALFCHHDGKTAGPSSFKGPIGDALTEDLTQLPIVEFA